MSSPTQRSKKHLLDRGYTVAVVERWNPHARIRQDLWGFADLIAMQEGCPPLLIQTTSGSSLANRRAKLIALDTARIALLSGFQIELHGWRKVKLKRGGKAMRWEPRVEPVTIEDLPCPPTLSSMPPDSAA